MMWILRWPVVLILLVLTFVNSWLPAAATAGAQLRIAALNDTIESLRASSPFIAGALEYGAQANWLEAGLWFAAGLFFLISAVRLMRRTQGFWMWLLGFACYGGRWAVTQQNEGGLIATVQSITPESIAPENLTPEAAPVQLGLLAFHLVVGLIILVIDAADRAYWDRNGR